MKPFYQRRDYKTCSKRFRAFNANMIYLGGRSGFKILTSVRIETFLTARGTPSTREEVQGEYGATAARVEDCGAVADTCSIVNVDSAFSAVSNLEAGECALFELLLEELFGQDRLQRAVVSPTCYPAECAAVRRRLDKYAKVVGPQLESSKLENTS